MGRGAGEEGGRGEGKKGGMEKRGRRKERKTERGRGERERGKDRVEGSTPVLRKGWGIIQYQNKQYLTINFFMYLFVNT